MKVESFRELLLKKADGDLALQSLIKYCRDEIILDGIMETLEKMARARHKGDAANMSVRHFGTEMDPETEPHMLREALGHHVSRYKSALNSGRSQIANQHARQAFKLMNMADIAQKHSGGKLSFEHVSPHPWERNKYTSQYDASHPKVQEGKYKVGDFVTKTKGLNYRGNDYGFLQQAPHESYKGEVKKHGHLGAYPFEQIRVNGKYIPIEDVADIKGYEHHPFDHHPILSHFDESMKDRTPERDQQYIQEHEDYYNKHPHIQDYFAHHQKLEEANPEEYAKRGSAAGGPVHKEVPKLKIDDIKQEAPAELKQEVVQAPTADNSLKLIEDALNVPGLSEEAKSSLKAYLEQQRGKK